MASVLTSSRKILFRMNGFKLVE